MAFEEGELYDRDEIHDELNGGETMGYLPQSDYRILCLCYEKKMNPDGPREIQVGNYLKVAAKARLLRDQAKKGDGTIPVFLKRPDIKDVKRWEYQGRYTFSGLSSNAKEIKDAEAKSGRHGELEYLLRFEPATT